MSNKQNDIYYENKREYEENRLAEIQGYKPKPSKPVYTVDNLLKDALNTYKTMNKIVYGIDVDINVFGQNKRR